MGAQSRASLLKKKNYNAPIENFNDVEISESKSKDPFVSLQYAPFYVV